MTPKQSPEEKAFWKWWKKNYPGIDLTSGKNEDYKFLKQLEDAWRAAIRWYKRTHCKMDGRCDRA